MCKKVVGGIFAILIFIVIVWLAGCQTDVHGGVSLKAFHKSENSGEVWKSRAAGPSYTGGHNGFLWDWGDVKED